MRRYDESLLEKLFLFIKEYQRNEGCSPSYREITKHFPRDFSSTAKVKSHLGVLQSRGLLESERDGRIAMDDRLKAETIFAPLMGKVVCGEPNEEIANIEENIALPKNIFGGGELFTLMTYGESMVGYGINEGDYVVVRKQNTANDGEVVVALVDGKNTLKRLYHKGKKIILHPENEEMEDIVVRECDIQGVLVGRITIY